MTALEMIVEAGEWMLLVVGLVFSSGCLICVSLVGLRALPAAYRWVSDYLTASSGDREWRGMKRDGSHDGWSKVSRNEMLALGYEEYGDKYWKRKDYSSGDNLPSRVVRMRDD
jgi:hypothetical protein